MLLFYSVGGVKQYDAMIICSFIKQLQFCIWSINIYVFDNLSVTFKKRN